MMSKVLDVLFTICLGALCIVVGTAACYLVTLLASSVFDNPMVVPGAFLATLVAFAFGSMVRN